MGETKRADEVRGVGWIRGENVVGEMLKRIRVGKARGLRRWEQEWLNCWDEMRCGGARGHRR